MRTGEHETELTAGGLQLLSVVIPARDEEGYIASTIEHLHLELRLNSLTDGVKLVHTIPCGAEEEDVVGFVCEVGDPVALGRAILEAVQRREELAEIGEACRQAMRRRNGFHVSTHASRAWAESPCFAPDRDRRISCLKAIIAELAGVGENAESSGSEAATEGRVLAHGGDPGTDSNAGSNFTEETRVRWLMRVVRTSYWVGGIRGIFRRLSIGSSTDETRVLRSVAGGDENTLVCGCNPRTGGIRPESGRQRIGLSEQVHFARYLFRVGASLLTVAYDDIHD
jgi:hypothetical protein